MTSHRRMYYTDSIIFGQAAVGASAPTVRADTEPDQRSLDYGSNI